MSDFDIGSIWAQLVTWENGLIVLGCGGAMELFKRGPLTRAFVKTPAGEALAYYAPVVWAWLFLFAPIGLAPENASTGSKILLGVVLGTLTDSLYDWTVQAVKRLLKARLEPEPAPAPDAQPPDGGVA